MAEEHREHVIEDGDIVSIDCGAHFENSYCIAPDGKAFVLTALDGGKAKMVSLGVEISDLL